VYQRYPPDVVRQLRNSNHTALQLRDLHSLGVVCFHKIPCRQEVGDLVSLCSWQLLHLLANHDADPVEECRKGSVVLPGASLPQERVLLGGLVSEDEDIHFSKGYKRRLKNDEREQ
jgi:hypothetical protein